MKDYSKMNVTDLTIPLDSFIIHEIKDDYDLMPHNASGEIPFEQINSIELNTQSCDRNPLKSIDELVVPFSKGKVNTENSINGSQASMPKSMQKVIKRVSNRTTRTIADDNETANSTKKVTKGAIRHYATI